MAWTAGTSLIASLDELKKFVGPTKLENLEGADFDVDDLLLRASDAVRAAVVAEWSVDPGVITNTGDYKPAVVEHVLAILTKRGFLDPPEGQPAPLDPFEWSRPALRSVKPVVSEGDRPSRYGRLVPRVRNVSQRYF